MAKLKCRKPEWRLQLGYRRSVKNMEKTENYIIQNHLLEHNYIDMGLNMY